MANIPEAAVAFLRENPDTADQFDQQFGEGASAQYLVAPQETPAEPAGEPEEGGSVVLDLIRAPRVGIGNAIEETGDGLAVLAESVGLPAGVTFGPDAENGIVEFHSVDELNEKGGDVLFGRTDENAAEQPETIAGSIATGIFQFGADFAAFGKALQGLKTITKTGHVAKVALQGGLADFFAFDGHDGNLSNLIENLSPDLRDTFLTSLAVDEDDTELEARLKNSLDGVLGGAAVDGVVQLLKFIKGGRKALADGGEKAAEEFVAENADQLDDINVQFVEWAEAQALAAGEAAERGAVKATESPHVLSREERTEPRINTERLVTQLREQEEGWLPLSDVDATVYNPFKSGDIAEDITQISQAIRPMLDKSTVSLEKQAEAGVAAASEQLGLGMDEAMRYFAQTAKNAEDTVVATQSAITIQASLNNFRRNLNEKYRKGEFTDADEAKARYLIAREAELQAYIERIGAGVARSLGGFRNVAMPSLSNAKLNDAAIQDIISGGSKVSRKELMEAMILVENSPRAARRLAKRYGDGSKFGLVTKYFINSILSGPKTHLINITSNAVKTVVMPMERIMGGNVREGLDIYLGEAMAAKDAVKYMAKAFREGQNILDSTSTIVEADQAISGRFDFRGIREAVNSVVTIPSRFLAAEDEFFKQMNVRGKLYADLMAQARTKYPRDADKRARWVAKKFDSAFTKEGVDADGNRIMGGVMIQSQDTEFARQFGREATFTQELLPRTAGKGFQTLRGQVPGFQFILPFVRTPTNIFRDVVARTPGINMLQKEYRENMLGHFKISKTTDPVEKARLRENAAKARGQMVMGTALYGTALALAYEGKLTGGGPADPKQRQALMETGWRPYSFKSTGPDGEPVYTSYQRMDPFGMFLGLVADAKDVYANVGQDELDQISLSIGIALARNLTSKSYLTGVTDILNAATNPDRSFATWRNRFVASFVPTGAKQISEGLGITDDPYMREVRTMLDAIRAKIPGLSDTVMPKRSWITGEPVPYPEGFMFGPAFSPFAQSRGKQDPVLDVMAELRHGFTEPPRKLGNVELTPEQYDRFVQLVAKPTRDGMSLHERLTREYHKSGFQRFGSRPRSLDDFKNDDPRLKKFQRIISLYQKKAVKALIKEIPELKEAHDASRKIKSKVSKGRYSEAEKIRNLLP